MSSILVTGANSGIGLALCKQLCKDHGVKVFLGSRNADRGSTAMEQVKEFAGKDAQVELLVIDVSSDESVQQAAQSLRDQNVILSAIVNNAGAGIAHNVANENVMDVNVMGPKRVVDAFEPLLDPEGSRIVNVGSGAGPMYVRVQPVERQKHLCNPDITWEEIQQSYNRGVPEDDPVHGHNILDPYGLTKALLFCYTQYLAKELKPKNVSVYCLAPGYIATNMTKGMSGALPVEQGTVSIRHCLFDAKPEQSGWFFGSDGKRSQAHVLRNPGEPEFDGVIDWDKVEAKQ